MRARTSIAILIACVALGATAPGQNRSLAAEDARADDAAANPGLAAGDGRADDAAATETRTERAGESRRAVEDQLIVRFAPGVGNPARERIAARRARGLAPGPDLDVARLEVVRTDPRRSLRQAARRLQRHPGVQYAEPDPLMHASLVPSDTHFSLQWAHENTGQSVNGTSGTPDADMDTELAWDATTGSNSTVIAVVDTGIQTDHPDLDARIWINPGESGSGRESNGQDDDGNGLIDDWRGWSFARDSNDISDIQGHGTAVAGILGAEADNGQGVAGTDWQAELMIVQTGEESSFPTSTAIASMDYAADMGAAIVNASFGGPASEAMEDTISSHPNTLFVAAAGNSGADNDAQDLHPCTIPADNVICVAASDQDDELASFSNYGATSVDLAAPGTNIATTGTDSTYVIGAGTSFATPLASGAAGLVAARDPDATAKTLRQALLSSVDATAALRDLVATGGRLNAAAAVASVDDTPPDTQIESGPQGTVHSSDVEFTYSSPESGVSFQCRLDGGSWTDCPATGKSYSGLAEAEHTFEVRAVDLAGNIDPTPAARTFTVDLPPETSLTEAPPSPTGETEASFSFTSDDTGASFQCSLDSAGWSACSSPQAYSGLAEGSHSFEVRAVDAGGTADPSPASHLWEIDTTAPSVAIDSAPADPSNRSSASFSFSASDPGAAFQCRLDSADWSACSSPQDYSGLAEGSHDFEVRAVDELGNAGAPAAHAWEIDLAAPETEIASGPPEPTRKTEASFELLADDPEAGFQCRLDSADWSACSSPQDYSGLAEGSHDFEVRAVDPAGNADPTPAQRTLTVDLTAPQTRLDSGPNAVIASRSALFSFSDDEGSPSFRCRLDGKRWRDCSQGFERYRDLSEGDHAVQVQAIDAAGNADPTPAQRHWAIDVTGPLTRIASAFGRHLQSPRARVRARFAFRAHDRWVSERFSRTAESSVRLYCRLDRRRWRECSQGSARYALRLDHRWRIHAFRLVAIDELGNRTWSRYLFRARRS